MRTCIGVCALVVSACGFRAASGTPDGGTDANDTDARVPDARELDAATDAAVTIDGSLVDAPPALACATDPGYTMHPTTGVRYRAVAQPRSWTMAQADCAAADAHLVVIDDAAEDAHIDGLLATETWIGFSDQAVEGTFVWVTGTNAGYTNWRPDGNPNDGSGTDPQDCAEIDETGGKWNDDSCPEPGAYVCECGA